MKNCLIVLGVLFGCFLVALFLVVHFNLHVPGGGRRGMRNPEIAGWRDYDPGPLQGMEVSIYPDKILLYVPQTPHDRKIEQNGRWFGHTFSIDSHLDAPPEIAVAHEQPDEELEVDLGNFVPDHPGKVSLVKVYRGETDAHPYPVYRDGMKVAYPPPKGLIRPGMPEMDLQFLPWHSDRVDSTPRVYQVDVPERLSDGKDNQPYYPPDHGGDDQESAEIYTYHSDRPDATPLLVTVQRGRVVEVTGGLEESSDPPYAFPTRSPNDTSAPPPDPNRTWGQWLFQQIFTQ